jgi:hypothetical protein
MFIRQNKRRTIAALIATVVLLGIGLLLGALISSSPAKTLPAVTSTSVQTVTVTHQAPGSLSKAAAVKLRRSAAHDANEVKSVRRCLGHSRLQRCVERATR